MVNFAIDTAGVITSDSLGNQQLMKISDQPSIVVPVRMLTLVTLIDYVEWLEGPSA